MRVGIFGGTFNPVHLGHTALASYVCNLGLVDEVWLMVTPQNPFKQDARLLDEATRLQMAMLAVEDFPRLRASDFEFHLPRPSYTYITLQELEKAYPDNTFSLLIGEDNWQKFGQWRNSAEILTRYPIIVYPREESDSQRVYESTSLQVYESTSLRVYEPAPLYPVSSTSIRTAIAAGEDVSQWLDPRVNELIRQLHLYQPSVS